MNVGVGFARIACRHDRGSAGSGAAGLRHAGHAQRHDVETLTIDRPKLSPEDEKKLMEAQRNNRVSE